MIRVGSNVMEKGIVLSVREREFELGAYQEVLAVCEEIRKEAKTQLERMITGNQEDAEIDKAVCDFLKKSIEKILGPGAVSKIFGDNCCFIPELTEVLCYVISEVGSLFAKNLEETKDEA